jgi:cytochrome c
MKRLLGLALAGLLLGGGAVQTADLIDGFDAGARAYEQCWACHSLKPDESRVGPSLHGIFGREAGTLESFNRYSEPMKQSGVVWTEETLAAYITNPRKFIPGTRMTYPGLKDPEVRDALIDYLKRQAR